MCCCRLLFYISEITGTKMQTPYHTQHSKIYEKKYLWKYVNAKQYCLQMYKMTRLIHL